MTTETSNPVPRNRTFRSIGAVAARKRDELEQFKAARRKAIEKLNEEQALLAKAVAEAEAQARRQTRNKQLDDQKQLKFILGGLVLGSLRALGEAAFAMTTEDLKKLSEKERELLNAVLTTGIAPAASGMTEDEAPGQRAGEGVDVLL